MTTLALRGIKKVYDHKPVVHGIDLDIATGEFVVLVGPSGCGKSTLIRMIAGLEDISEGDLSIDARRVNDVEPADRGCAMVFQNYALYPHMTVQDNIAYPLKIAGMEKTERARRAQAVAAMLGLDTLLDRRPAQLSGGQRQRVAMGRAIVREPAVFLFDEPLSNLDAKLRIQMRIEIRRLHKRLKATSIFVTHDQVEAMTLADKLVVMNGGRLEQVGAPAEVYRQPASTFVATFLGSPPMNLLEARVSAREEVVLDAAPSCRIAFPGLELAVGECFTLGIRPEDIRVADGHSHALAARVELVEELGGSHVAYCWVGESNVAVVLPRERIVKEGTALPLEFPAAAMHAFNTQSGKRLALTALREADSSRTVEVTVAPSQHVNALQH